jgi:hypothetical protein
MQGPPAVLKKVMRRLWASPLDSVFKVMINPVEEIDWSDNPKRLFFSSSVR